jgi:hypothetical protein
MQRLARIAVWFLGVTTGLMALGKLIARRMEGQPEPDDPVVTIAAVWGGREFSSRADPLLSCSAVAVFGGIQLDLTAASPPPEGARIALRAVLGGIQVLVPPTWRLEIADGMRAGGVEAKVTPADDLPADAPTVLVEVSGRAGGVAIAAR